jgi:hypothetical protein
MPTAKKQSAARIGVAIGGRLRVFISNPLVANDVVNENSEILLRVRGLGTTPWAQGVSDDCKSHNFDLEGR